MSELIIVRGGGDLVEKSEIIAFIGNTGVKSPLNGVFRGLIRDGYLVPKEFKIGDIDPRRDEQQNCYTKSDKAINIGVSALETILYLRRKV